MGYRVTSCFPAAGLTLMVVTLLNSVSAQVSISSSTPDVLETTAFAVTCDFTGFTLAENFTELTLTKDPSGAPTTVYYYFNSTEHAPDGAFSGRVTSFSISDGGFSVQVSASAQSDKADYECKVKLQDGTTLTNQSHLLVYTVCDTTPCANNATCNETTPTTYSCTCLPDYTGALCETKVNDCADDPCQNGAACVDGTFKYTCQCDTCFNGTNCEVRDFSPCGAYTPCKQSATCTDIGCSNWKCACPINYSGKNCTATCVTIKTISTTQKVLLGDSLTLNCASYFSNAPYWSASTSGSAQLAASGVYTMASVLRAHAKSYYCFSNNGACTQRKSVDVSVWWELKFNGTEKQNVTLTKGQDLELECEVEAKPPAQVRWRFTPQSLTTKTENETVVEQGVTRDVTNATTNSSELTISGGDADASGVYECVATLAGDVQQVIKKVTVSADFTAAAASDGPLALEWWMILLIVLACLLVIAAILLIVYFCVIKKKSGVTAKTAPSKDAERHKSSYPEKRTNSDKYHSDMELERNNAKSRGSRYQTSYDRASPPPPESATGPRTLPTPVHGGPRKLPPLNMDEERDRDVVKKKKKKKKKVIHEEYERENAEEDDRYDRRESYEY